MLTISTIRKHKLSKGKESTRLRRRYIAHEDFFVFHCLPFRAAPLLLKGQMLMLKMSVSTKQRLMNAMKSHIVNLFIVYLWRMPGRHRILKWIDVLRSPVPYSSNFEATKPAKPSWFIFAYQYLFQHIKTPNLSPYATISEERALIIPYTRTIWKMSCKSFYSEVWLPFFLSKFLIWKQASTLLWWDI